MTRAAWDSSSGQIAEGDSAVRLLVGGEWRDGESRIDNVDPGTGRAIGTVEFASDLDVADALDSAETALSAWRTTLPNLRGQYLIHASRLLDSRASECATALMSESGKTYNEARGEVARAVDTLRWNGEEASRLSGTAFPGVVKGSRRVSLPEPVGVVVAITAWNFPVLLIARKVGAALAAGCTVIVKASEHCPRSAAILVECLQSAGLPHGAVNLLFGEPERLSQLLINSPHTKALTFTGSTAVGKSLAMMASSRLLRCVMELGGHAPVIVTDESAIDELIALTAPAKFESAGQSCMAPTRYIARRDIYDEVVRRLSEYAAGLKVGHGSDPGVQMGALIHAGRVSALTALVDDAVSRGAKVAHGGGKISGPGAYFEATVLYDVPRDAQIMHEEPFGPIACVVPFDSIEEAVEIANETAYGLAAYVFTDSITDRDYAIDRLEFSNVAVNQTAPSLPDVPIGGVKDSGYGYEGGTIGVHSFMHFRLVSVSSLRGTPGGSND